MARRTLAGILAAMAFSFLLAACQGREEQKVLRVADVKGSFQVPLEAAHALDGASYRIEWSSFPTPAAALEALGADAIDVAPAGDAGFLFAYGNGLPGRVVASSRREHSAADTAIVVREASAMHSVPDLKGKRIAVNRLGDPCLYAWRPARRPCAVAAPTGAFRPWDSPNRRRGLDIGNRA